MADLRRAAGAQAPDGPAAAPAGSYDGRVLGAWLLLAILVALPAAASLWEAAHRTQPAPGFRLLSTGFEGGAEGKPQPTNLTDYRGRTLVLDLMAVACRACRAVTADTLLPLWREFGQRPDFAILSIDTWADPAAGSGNGTSLWRGETRDALVALQRQEGVPWRHALDTDGVWLRYSAVTLPRILVVDASGAIVFDHVGVPGLQAVRSAVVASLAASATPVPLLDLGLPALALVAGLLSVVSPCSAGLLPAYLGVLAQGGAAPRRVLSAGLAAALGAVSLYALLAVAFAAAAPALHPLLPWMAPLVALALVAAGAVALAGRGLPGAGGLAARLGPRRGPVLFGVAFALAGFGCTGPVFLPVLAAGFLDGPGPGFFLFLLYALAVAAVLLAVAWLVAAGAQTRLAPLLRRGPLLRRVAGILLVASGLVLLASSLQSL